MNDDNELADELQNYDALVAEVERLRAEVQEAKGIARVRADVIMRDTATIERLRAAGNEMAAAAFNAMNYYDADGVLARSVDMTLAAWRRAALGEDQG